MSKTKPNIYIWQRIVSPHTATLATGLAELGCNVIYVAEQEMSAERAKQGWQAPKLDGVCLIYAPTIEEINEAVKNAPTDSIHLCQGIHGNGLIKEAQRALRLRGLQQWVVMETVKSHGFKGLLKKLLYRTLFLYWNSALSGVLAIGYKTAPWVVARGMSKNKVFPFAYFLPENYGSSFAADESKRNASFEIIFVGNLIERKKVDVLIKAIENIKIEDIHLSVVGSGSEEEFFKKLGKKLLPNRVSWLGRLPMSEVPKYIHRADCLVLPSRHDGWGAVVSEALILGTPAICSDACGSSGVVEASGHGGVFERNNIDALSQLLQQQYSLGKVSAEKRAELRSWALERLSNKAGARYLLEILQRHAGEKTLAPWEQ